MKTVLRNDYLKKIRLFLDRPLVKVISGLRRTGKSVMLTTLAEILKKDGVPGSNIVYINKESLEFDSIKTYSDLNLYVQKALGKRRGKKYILIDEIQEIGGWEKAVASFLAQKAGDIVITGSNAHLLSAELATLITGRYVEIPVFPLSFREFLDFRRLASKIIDLEKEFGLYLKYGGLPAVHHLSMNDDAIYPYLNSVLSAILLRDVVRRHSIRDVTHLERIAAFVFDNCGSITTAKSIADYFKSQRSSITVDTVQSYLEFLTQAFLIRRIKRYDLKGKRHLEFFDKYYMGDIGLRHGLIGYRDADISGILENIVLLELLRRGYDVSVGSLNGAEVDFVAQNQKGRMYVQVCYLLANNKTAAREFGNLEKIRDNYPKIVLSLDKHNPDNRNGIQHRNIIDFLLDGKYLPELKQPVV